jgi:hydrogenase maturation protease
MVWKILAMGNPLKQDDSIALRLADALKEFKIIKAETVPENFISKGDKIILLDAIHFDAPPGEVKLLNKEDIEEEQVSSHNMTSLLMTLTQEIKLIGIQPARTGFGSELSPTLKEKFPLIREEVKRILEHLLKD